MDFSYRCIPGIGKSISKNLASVGMNLVLTGRNKKKLIELSDQLEEEYNIIAKLSYDLSHSSEVYRLLKKRKTFLLTYLHLPDLEHL